MTEQAIVKQGDLGNYFLVPILPQFPTSPFERSRPAADASREVRER